MSGRKSEYNIENLHLLQTYKHSEQHDEAYLNDSFGRSFQKYSDDHERENQIGNSSQDMYSDVQQSPVASKIEPTTPISKKETNNSKPSLLKDLENSVYGNELDILKAGTAVVDAYERKEKDIQQSILTFVRKYWRQITVPKMPDTLDVYTQSFILHHGYGILSQMAVVGNSYKSNISNFESEDFPKLSGTRLNITKRYYYPSEAPFTGQLIELRTLPTSNQKAHIKLKHALIHVLRNSCSNVTDIKFTDWSFPGDKCSKHINPHQFPAKFYDDLKEMFAEYFNISHEELDTPWIDSYESLILLEPHPNLQAKKAAFKQLAAARNAYLTKTFHEEFRSAMTEIRHSTYCEVTETWTNRKRGFARKAIDMMRPTLIKKPSAEYLQENETSPSSPPNHNRILKKKNVEEGTIEKENHEEKHLQSGPSTRLRKNRKVE